MLPTSQSAAVTAGCNHTWEDEQMRSLFGEGRSDFLRKLNAGLRSVIAVDIVRQVEAEGHFPKADYAFDNGVLTARKTD